MLGGTADTYDWRLEPDADTTANILARTSALVPEVATAQVLEAKVGLRPGRKAVRLEMEAIGLADCAVIHCYGHGGGGFTLSWGCADEVLGLARAFLAG